MGGRLRALVAVAACARGVAAAPRRVVVHVSSYGRRSEKIRVVLSSLLDQSLLPDLCFYSHACRDAAREERLGCAWRPEGSPSWDRLCGRNCSDDGRGPSPFARPSRVREISYTAADRGPTMRVLALLGPARAGDVARDDLVVLGDDDKLYPTDLVERLAVAAAPRGVAVGCRGWNYPRASPVLDELAHSTYGYARMRYENKGRSLAAGANRSRVHVLAGSDAYAFGWSPCVPEAVARVLDGFTRDEALFDDPIISFALAECGYDLFVVPCGEEPINREDQFGDYEDGWTQGRSATIAERDARNIGVYRKLFFARDTHARKDGGGRRGRRVVPR